MNDFYVYIHMDEDFNVRYVGKGRGKRAYKVSDRNPHWNNIFKNHTPLVDFVAIKLTEKEAFDLEIEMIKIYREDGYKLCNLTDGGEGLSGFKPSDETKKKLSEAKKGKKSSRYGKHHSEESKNKMSEAKKGIKPTAETCKKMSESKSGEKHPQAKLTTNDIIKIREMLSNNTKGTVIAKQFNVSVCTICAIKHNRTWKHLKVEDK